MKKETGLKKVIMFMLFAVTVITAAVFCASAENTVEKVRGYYEYTNEYGDYDYDYVDVYIEGENSFEFNAESIYPKLSVYYMDQYSQKVYLSENTDYTVKYYDSSVEPGEYCAYIESTDGQKISFECEFDYSIFYDQSKLRVDDIPSVTFAAKYIRPSVKVYYGSILLDSSFYDVEYYNCYDAGTATAEIEMDYCFDYYSETKRFTINPAPVSALKISSIPAVMYNGDEQTPEPEITYNGEELYRYYDYSISYKNNVNAGTATATLRFSGNYKGSKTVNFTINKAPASMVKVEIGDQEYTGSKVKPYIYAYIGWNYLESGTDYTVSYSNNVNPGTATATLKFNGKNITGTKKVTFKIAVGKLYYVSGEFDCNRVYIYWYGQSNYKYKIYKYDPSKKAYVYYKATKNPYGYEDTEVKELTTYKYKVRAYVKIGDKTYYGPYSDEITVKTSLFAPKKVTLTTKKDCINVKWSKCPKATGYYVYRYDYKKGKRKLVYTATENSTVSYSDKNVVNYREYSYYVVAYKTQNGKKLKSCNSIDVYSLSPESITRGVKLSSKTSYKIYNTQGKKTTLSSTVNLSSADIKTLKSFAKKHFTSKMTSYEKVEYTLMWIHDNVTYASASKDWNKISGKTYVDAIFNYRLGQCAQYNGALAGMMSYLGYNVQMIKGYRQGSSGAKWQHFWTECKINGLTYVMECGNKKDGSWHYTFVPYSGTMGYTKNGKYISGH